RMKNEVYRVEWKCRNYKEHVANNVARPVISETELEDIFVKILHELAKDLKPLFNKPADRQVINSDIKALDTEISELLSSPKKATENKDLISELIARRAYLQFERASKMILIIKSVKLSGCWLIRI
ncbi:MAG: hypothetical protein M0T74_11930, partial [Desulfitobacterium hafniense]|nr:hypothetical protein [Desulfitobacterium hafniense]